jgi:hypothetical protein
VVVCLQTADCNKLAQGSLLSLPTYLLCQQQWFLSVLLSLFSFVNNIEEILAQKILLNQEKRTKLGEMIQVVFFAADTDLVLRGIHSC